MELSSHGNIRSLELSLLWNFRSSGAKVPRTFVTWNIRSRGTFVPRERTFQELQKLQKGDYPPAHRLSVNVLLSNSTFLKFLQFSMCNAPFFTFIFAVLLRFCSCSVTLFRVRSTWYGARSGPHHF